MKITCEFCKTEYSVPKLHGGPVRCALCGHTWTPVRTNRRGVFMTFLASLCALLSAIVFTVAVITRHQMDTANQPPLVARATAVRAVTDAGGARLAVDGVIENTSDQIYGVPDMLIIAYDANNNVVATHKFMPSATLLDAGTSIDFTHTIPMPTTSVKRISVELMEIGNQK